MVLVDLKRKVSTRLVTMGQSQAEGVIVSCMIRRRCGKGTKENKDEGRGDEARALTANLRNVEGVAALNKTGPAMIVARDGRVMMADTDNGLLSIIATIVDDIVSTSRDVDSIQHRTPCSIPHSK